MTSLLAMYNSTTKRDILIIGTDNHILAYDVELNSDIFNREVSDGVISTTTNQQLIFVGGNCAIQGFDLQGNEQYWTTTGGNVNALLVNENDQTVIVGSDDYMIYLYQNESVISELSQTDSIVALTWLQQKQQFAYALQNHSLGVYQIKDQKRLWKTKTKDSISCLTSYDMNSDSIAELIVGYENGTMEIRSSQNGQILQQIHSTHSVSIVALLVSDYRNDNQPMLLCCYGNGQVEGYLPQQQQLLLYQEEQELDQKLEQLQEMKNQLVMEYKYLTRQNGIHIQNIKSVLKPNHSQSCVELIFTSEHDPLPLAMTHTTLEESQFIYNTNSNTNVLHIPLRPEKNQSFDITIQLFISNQCIIHEYVYKIPSFCMYEPIHSTNNNNNIASQVTLELKQSMEQVMEWFNTSFNIVYNNNNNNMNGLQMDMICIRDESLLQLQFDAKSSIFLIRVDSMEVAGDLIQDLCQYMNIQELKLLSCQFPLEMNQLTMLLERMEQLTETRQLLSTEMADSTLYIKENIVKAENARLMNNMKESKEYYEQLKNVNMELIHEHGKRSKNHEELVECLKSINHIITKASRLRMGNAKISIVNEARQAIKSKNWNMLLQVLQS